MKTRHWFGGRHPGRQWVILALLALSFLMGCASPNQNPYMYTGAGLGAAPGAGLGAAVNNRNPWKGAAIGGLLGGAGAAWPGKPTGAPILTLISRKPRVIISRLRRPRVIINHSPIMDLRPDNRPIDLAGFRSRPGKGFAPAIGFARAFFFPITIKI